MSEATNTPANTDLTEKDPNGFSLKNTAFRFDLGILLLRLAVGGLMVLHGFHKLQNGHDGIVNMLKNAGLPEFLWYGVPVGEVVAPVLLVLGIFTVPSALLVAFTMLVSVFLAFGDRLWTLNQVGGWVVELNVLFLVASLTIALTGPGRFSLGKSWWK